MDLGEIDRRWMQRALELAHEAERKGEVPVGAVVVRDDAALGEGYNRPIEWSDPSAHAEIVALRTAGETAGNYRLPGSTLYVTLEPCLMCVGAMVHARIQRLVYGAPDTRPELGGGAVGLLQSGAFNHACEVVSGVLRDECTETLNAFFATRRATGPS